jgi:hypothetical protein
LCWHTDMRGAWDESGWFSKDHSHSSFLKQLYQTHHSLCLALHTVAGCGILIVGLIPTRILALMKTAELSPFLDPAIYTRVGHKISLKCTYFRLLICNAYYNGSDSMLFHIGLPRLRYSSYRGTSFLVPCC